MKNSSLYRSNLSDEKVAFLSEIKRLKDLNKEDNTPKAYKRQEKDKEKELDILWQGFRSNVKDEKSPGIYLLTGFIAGALCMFVMNSILSISSNIFTAQKDPTALGQPKFEKKISRKEKLSQITSSVAVVPSNDEQLENTIPAKELYTVKSGDSMSSITYRFYGKYDLDKVEKIRQVNNLENENKLTVGQELIIPLD